MSKLLAQLLILAFGSVCVFAQCAGTDSFTLDGLNETADKLAKLKAKSKVVATKSGSSEPAATLSSNDLQKSDPWFNPDVLLDWNVGFSEGRAKIVVCGKSGFIDTSGGIAIKPQYELASCFSDGLAAVRIGPKLGFIDSNGKLVVPAKFDAADNFSEGLALVKVGNLWGYIEKSGEFAIKPKFERAESFSDGMAAIGFYDKSYVWTTHNAPNGKWMDNFIDRTGEIMFSSNFDGIYEKFNAGMALVGRNIGYRDGVIAEMYFIDKQGRELWKLDSSYLTRFSDDLMVIAVSRDSETKRDKYSFVDRSGKRATKNAFDNLNAFSEGLAVATLNGKDGFIDKTGEFVIKPEFSSAGNFSEGLAAVWKDGRSGFIDSKGNSVITLRFNSSDGFKNGFAAVEVDGRLGYIDRKGKFIWKPSK